MQHNGAWNNDRLYKTFLHYTQNILFHSYYTFLTNIVNRNTFHKYIYTKIPNIPHVQFFFFNNFLYCFFPSNLIIFISKFQYSDFSLFNETFSDSWKILSTNFHDGPSLNNLSLIRNKISMYNETLSNKK